MSDRKIFIALLSIFCLLNCNHRTNLVSNDYESNVNQAELFLLDKKYSDALFFYKGSYAVNDYCLGVDCYNAMLCSLYVDDFDEFTFWAFELANKGINISFFQSKIFNELKENENWDSFAKNISVKNKHFVANHNDKLKKSLQYLVEQDQEQYCKLQYGYDSSLAQNALNMTFRIDLEAKKLIEQYEDFSEEKIGLNIINDTILSRTPVFWALSRHNFQSEGEPFFENFLQTMYHKGLIRKDVIELTKHTPMSSNIVCINNRYYVDKNIPKDEEFTRINIKKLKFIINNQHLKFLIFPEYYRIGSKSDENDKSDENVDLFGLTLIEGI